jgi:hypothetical protein
MFSRDLVISGIDPVHARNLWTMVSLEQARVRRPPLAFAVLDGGRPNLLVVGGRSVEAPSGFERITADNAEALASALGVRLLLAAEEDALRDVVEDVQTRWKHGDDHFVQTEVLLDRVRIAIEDGDVILWPDFFTVALRLEAASMRRFFDIVFPPRTCAILYLFRNQAVHSSLIAVRGERDIETVTGHYSLVDHLGTYHPWQDGYPRIVEAAELVHGTPTLGFFGEADVVQEMILRPRSGQLSRAILDRSVIIDPLPGWMAATLGVDALSRAARMSMSLLEKVDRLGLGRRFDLESMRNQVRDHIDRKMDFEALLGFDPFEYLSEFLSWWSGRSTT